MVLSWTAFLLIIFMCNKWGEVKLILTRGKAVQQVDDVNWLARRRGHGVGLWRPWRGRGGGMDAGWWPGMTTGGQAVGYSTMAVISANKLVDGFSSPKAFNHR